ncbi:Afadin and alpha-actinin-binding-domain-containing protein [Crassisporium funariophilum]|nr:Afadin and alpha-actinin-binding-domain-containing protein [Crassisporium funariophilum]
MAFTPRKLVHWEMEEPSLSGLGSPFFNGTYETSMVSTSSLEFINSQLVAHGFVPSPGLSLDGISNDDSLRVIKCLLGMLSQRVEDMARTEELTTKYRTLSYDHERMLSMYRTATDKAANAEREMNLHKSRLTATLRTLQSSENAHKQTAAELQRTRTLLQGVRATHVAEMKKKEKDIERMSEKWQKISEAQSKLSSTPSGMRCANLAVVDGTEVLGKGQGFLEVALEQAEQARALLCDENLRLRKLVLCAVNEIQSVLHQARCLVLEEQSLEDPTPFTLTALFPLAPANAAADQFNCIIAGLRETLTTLSKPASKPTTSKPTPHISDVEIERLQGIITKLQEEISCSQKQTMAHATETQAMFDKFAEDHRVATGEIGDMSVELLSGPLRDEEKDRLDNLRRELDMERQKFTDAAIKFGKEKAALEADRIKLLDEKRSWQVEMMLADLPPTPIPASPIRPPNVYKLSPRKSPHKSPHKSPRKSPAKPMGVGKAAIANSGRKAHRVSRRSLASPLKMAFSYETELIQPIPAPTFPTMKSLAGPTTSLLANSFVLPPPSPRASLPTKPALPPAMPDSPPETTVPQNQQPTSSSSSLSVPQVNNQPLTPPAVRRPFPVAKPFAQRMIHAYSPAKPSPLSRILMLTDSPLSPPRHGSAADDSLSPTSSSLEVVSEEVEDHDLGYAIFPSVPQPQPQMSLAAELGVESPPDTPLQEKKVEPNVIAPVPFAMGRGRVFHADPNAKKSIAVQDKGKGKAKAESAPRARTSAVGEKENSSKQRTAVGKAGKISPSMGNVGAAATTRKASTNPVVKPAVKANPAPSSAAGLTSRTKTLTKPPVSSGNSNGPRRVLINSVDAPPIAKGRKG